MEDIDRRIVALLAEDGRMSFTDLGKETGLSTSAVHQRVRRLEKRGVIRGYRAIIDQEALGLPLTAFVSIKAFDATAEDEAPTKIAKVKGVEACYSVAGDEAYILKVRVSSPVALEGLLGEIRAIAGVSTRTTVVLSVPFEDLHVQ
jgi:Lrp/AsnC family transcriptional regulator, leucine-responsive regulatory protein